MSAPEELPDGVGDERSQRLKLLQLVGCLGAAPIVHAAGERHQVGVGESAEVALAPPVGGAEEVERVEKGSSTSVDRRR